MSSDVAATPTQASDHGRPTVMSLTSAEVLRLRSRRLIQFVLILGFGLLLIAFALIFRASGEPSAADRARAEQQVAADQQACLVAVKSDPQLAADPNGPRTDEEFQQFCGTPELAFYLKTSPFTWVNEYVDGTLGVAVGFAVLLFLIGASAGGAEWSARTMPAVLYWEPRRLRVMAVKSFVVALVAVVVAAAAQLVWLLMAWILVSTRGSAVPETLPDAFLSDTAGGVGRGLVVAALAALGGFALANLTRNTGAALGAAFVYFAVAEPAIGFFAPRLVRWMPVTNVGAFLQPEGLQVPSGVSTSLPDGGEMVGMILISNLRGGLVLAAFVAVLLGVATLLFARRDVS